MNGGTRLRTRVAASLFAAAATLAIAGHVDAGTGGNESISVAPSTVESGAQITITGSGWFCAADVDIYIVDGGMQLVGTVPFASIVDGGFVTAATAPNTTGDYDVLAEYGAAQTSVGCYGQASDPFTVTGGSTTTTAPTTTTAATTTTTTTAAPTTSAATTTTTLVDGGGPTTTSASGGATTTVVGNEGPTTTLSAGPVSTLPVTGGSANALAPFALTTLALGALLAVAARRGATR